MPVGYVTEPELSQSRSWLSLLRLRRKSLAARVSLIGGRGTSYFFARSVTSSRCKSFRGLGPSSLPGTGHSESCGVSSSGRGELPRSRERSRALESRLVSEG